MQLPGPVLLLLVLFGLLLAAGCTAPSANSGGSGSTPAAMTATPAPGPVVPTVAYPPAEPYEIDPRFVRNAPGYSVDPALFIEVYHGRFTMNYNSEGLLATVERAPLVIEFSVKPGHANPNYCFFILTVRDAGSGEVVGQEGFARTFSTDSPKRLVFTRPGKYHLNLYGNWVDVDLSLLMKR